MLKRTKKIIMIALLLYFLIITLHVFLAIHDSQGIVTAKGNVSTYLFFSLQSGGGEESVVTDLTMMTLLSVLGSGLFIYLKNNNVFTSIQLRIGYRQFLKRGVINTFLSATGLSLLTSFYEMLLINYFYFPFVYRLNDIEYLKSFRPGLFSSNDLSEILLYIGSSAIGWGVFSILIFSIGLFVHKNALYLVTGSIVGLILILLPILGNMSSALWRAFSYSWFLFTLVAPGQYSFIGLAPPINILLAYILAVLIYLMIAMILIIIWYKQKKSRG